MKNRSEKTKIKIMSAVIELLEETCTENVNITQIAETADIAVGLVNYHFKSKDELLAKSIKYYIENAIAKESIKVIKTDLTPIEQLKASLHGYADFLERHGFISRLFIKYSCDSEYGNDIAKMGLEHYLPLLYQIKSWNSEIEAVIAINMVANFIHMAFMKSDLIRQLFGLDFLVKEQRDILVNQSIAIVFENQVQTDMQS